MKLKPCPFCASKDIGLNDEVDTPNSHYWSEVVCGNCCIKTSSYKTDTEALTAWNKRTKVEVMGVEEIVQVMINRNYGLPSTEEEERFRDIATAIHKELIKRAGQTKKPTSFDEICKSCGNRSEERRVGKECRSRCAP